MSSLSQFARQAFVEKEKERLAANKKAGKRQPNKCDERPSLKEIKLKDQALSTRKLQNSLHRSLAHDGTLQIAQDTQKYGQKDGYLDETNSDENTNCRNLNNNTNNKVDLKDVIYASDEDGYGHISDKKYRKQKLANENANVNTGLNKASLKSTTKKSDFGFGFRTKNGMKIMPSSKDIKVSTLLQTHENIVRDNNVANTCKQANDFSDPNSASHYNSKKSGGQRNIAVDQTEKNLNSKYISIRNRKEELKDIRQVLLTWEAEFKAKHNRKQKCFL